MSDYITVTGTLGTEPEHKVVGSGLERTTFRIASTERRRDPGTNEWIDNHTNWYSVTCFGRLATNVKASFNKGQRVIVTGKLRVRSFNREDGSQGTQVEIIANTAGHDLVFQTATANRRQVSNDWAASNSSEPHQDAAVASYEQDAPPVPAASDDPAHVGFSGTGSFVAEPEESEEAIATPF